MVGRNLHQLIGTTKKVLLIVDESFLNVMSRNIPYARVLQNLYNSTRILVSVNETVGRYPMNRYPYTNLNDTQMKN